MAFGMEAAESRVSNVCMTLLRDHTHIINLFLVLGIYAVYNFISYYFIYRIKIGWNCWSWKPFKKRFENVCCKMTTNYLGHSIFICHQKLNEEALTNEKEKRERKKTNSNSFFSSSISPSFISLVELSALICAKF